MKKVFGLEPSWIYEYNGKVGRWYQICYYSKMAFHDLLSYLPTYSTRKPDCCLGKWLFKLPTNLKMEFLSAFWDDEGCISKDGKIYGKSKSKKVIEELILLHKLLGVNCSLWKDNTSQNFAIYVHKDVNSIKNFSKVGFRHGVISRGDFKGMKKIDVFHELYSKF